MNGGYTIDYKYDGIKRATSIAYTVPKDANVKDLIEDVPHFYYGDKTFQGWSTDKEGKNIIDPKEYKVTANTTLYAQWARFDEIHPSLNGLTKGTDGKWAMYKDNAVDKTFTGLAKSTYNGLWYYVKDGYLDWNHTGFGQNPDTKKWYRVVNGRVDFSAQGIYKNFDNGVWYKTTNGRVTFDETGVFKNENGWWRVENSRVNFNANGIYKNENGWWKTTGGKVHFNETGIFSNENGQWYVVISKVDFSKNGKVTFIGKTYNVTNGKAKLA